MSTIREKPYIEELLASMSEQNLNDLKTILDSGGDNVNLSFATLTDSYKNKVTPVYFQFEDNGLKTGILIWTDTKCALICYHRFQDLIIFEFSPTYHTYTKIKQYCDINELRRVLDDTIEKKGAVDSGDAAKGSVPFADGEGGVTWNKPTEYIKGDDFEDAATTVKMIAVDDEGNLVKSDLPEGTFVVDSALSNVSENPVQNKVITEELDKIKDGRTAVGKAQTAQALDNVSENSGSVQEDPFIFQGTGTNNNTSETPTSPKAHQLEKQGNTICYNQLCNPTVSDSDHGITSTNNNDGTVTLNGTATSQVTLSLQNFDLISGYKYLLFADKNISGVTFGFESLDYGSLTGHIKTANSTETTRVRIRAVNGTVIDNVTIHFYIIDLTQLFNGDIPEYLLDHPEAFTNYYNGSLAYNEGTLVNCDGQYLVTIGFNQLNSATADNEQFIGNYYIQGSAQDYVREANNSYNCYRIKICHYDITDTEYCITKNKNETLSSVGIVRFVDKDYNLISGNESGYSVTKYNVISVPTNAEYMEISLPISADYKVCVNLSWDAERNGEYKDFVKHIYDTGNEELLAFDVKHYTGVIERNTGSVDLGTLTFVLNTNNGLYESEDLVSVIKKPNANSIKANIICNKYLTVKRDDSTSTNESISVSNSGKLCVKSNSSTITGTLQYELATPTTEQGTPFDEIIDVDDYGTMYWLDDNEDFVEVPQGCKLFYPADYALLIDDLGNYTNYDVTNLAKKSDLTDFIKQEDASSNITDVAGLTYKYKKLYKTGNVITLHVIAENGTGSDIAANNTLFTVPSDYYSLTYNIKGVCVLNNNVVTSVNIAYETGNVSCPTTALESGEYVYITLTYAIE